MAGLELLDAGLTYAAAGMYLLPVARASKSPGSIVGGGWPDLSSRDSAQIQEWAADPRVDGWAWHVGRNDATVFDVDKISDLRVMAANGHAHIMDGLLSAGAIQTSRPGTDRGHYVFANTGQKYGNQPGLFGQYGDVRGNNGVILLAPTPHRDGGEYAWMKVGWLTPVPEALRECLRPPAESAKAMLLDGEAAKWIDAQPGANLEPDELAELPPREWLSEYATPGAVRELLLAGGGSVYEAARDKAKHIVFAGQEGRKGLVLALNNLGDAYLGIMADRQAGLLAGEVRSTATAEAELDRAIAGAVALAVRRGERYDTTAWQARLAEKLKADGPEPGNEFWAARAELTDCLQFARSRRVGPWAMFGHSLVLALSIVPPHVVLPAIVGTVAGVNLFVALAGASGAIKSAAMGAAKDWLQLDPDPKQVKPGSGEGLAKCFAYIQRKQGQPAQQIGKEWSLVAYVPEVDTLNSTGSRGGSTLMAELRSAWSGERLGHEYAGDDKAIKVEGNRYRLGMTVGVQHEKARELFEDAPGGTPQRFLWMPTSDPSAPEVRPDEPPGLCMKPWPEPPFHNPLLDPDEQRKANIGVPADKSEFAQIVVPQQAWDEQDAHTWAKLRDPESVDPLDGHKFLVRLKVAVGLMILNGRYDKVSDEDWELAGMVLAVSDQTRAEIQDKLAAETLARNRSAGRAAGVREVAAAAVKDAAAIERVAGNLKNALSRLGGRAGRNSAFKKIARRDREYVDAAEDLLISRGEITKTETEHNGTKGYVLALVTDGTDVS